MDCDEQNPLPDHCELGFVVSRDEPEPGAFYDVGPVLCAGRTRAADGGTRGALTFYDSKIGGRPNWLVPTGLPDSADLMCGSCESPLPLLLQLYAPDEHAQPEGHHRQVLVFCCKSGACHSWPDKCIRVFRTNCSDDELAGFEAARAAAAAGTATPEDPVPGPVCALCGLPAPNRCSKCRVAHYCSRAHQTAHWTASHKLVCRAAPATGHTGPWRIPPDPSSDALRSLLRRSLYPERRLDIHEEWIDEPGFLRAAVARWVQASGRLGRDAEVPEASEPFFDPDLVLSDSDEGESDSDDDEQDEASSGPGPSGRALTSGNPAEDAALVDALRDVRIRADTQDPADMVATDEAIEEAQTFKQRRVDRAFLRFQDRVSHYRDQVLRYARFPDRRSPIPLWASNLERPLTADLPAGAFVQPGPRVPPCDRCGGARTFEFQVMPQLLAFMEVDHTRVDSIDWGTLLVYSCEGSCELGAPSSSSSGPGASDGPKGSRYAREVVCRQLFTSDGLANDLTVSGARFPRAAAASSSATITELD